MSDSCPTCGRPLPTACEGVGLRIRLARQTLGMSQTDLGQRMARSRTYAAVSDIERGKTDLSVTDLVDIAGILNVSPVDLLMDELR